MKIRWFGTAAVMLESDGYKIVFDPFLGMPLAKDEFRNRRAEAFKSADAILVTHGHFDHIHDIPSLYKESGKKIYATGAPCDTLLSLGAGDDSLCRINPGDIFRLGDFRISVSQGRHCRFDLAVAAKTIFKADTLTHPKRLMELWMINTRFSENGETLFYEIESEGKRVHLLGSMGLDDDTDYPRGADALILPFQGTGNPAATVRPIIERLRPKRILLDHYDDAFPPLSSKIATAGFVREMNGKGIPTAALRQWRTYEI